MTIHIRITASIAAGLFSALALAACTPAEPADDGITTDEPGPAAGAAVVQGRITFGPLQPVIQKDEPTPEIPPEAYEGRFVLVYRPDGETLVDEAAVQPDGAYRIELAPGEYVIDFTLVGIERAENIPAAVTLTAGQVLELDIAVDTGIR
ncbi:MAG TPA: hypothetical protein VMN57_01770 [Anaerolineales bacterium]|nr:hypothetical protein [Anaerolineales bacterium]